MRTRGSHGWREIDADAKRTIIDSIVRGTAPRGPFHLEIDLSDRCNVDCYFCNAMDVRTKEQVPLARVVEILDEIAPKGLRSVRFAGGGDPLFHREIENVLDAVHEKGLVIDNVTTNGLGLTPGVAQRLVAGQAREIVISLNTSDAPDYARMMQVKPAVFDKVVANVERLVAIRGEAPRPCLVIQFLLDRTSYPKMREMYELARRIGADVIAINLVLEIPRQRIDPARLLRAEDGELLRPFLREVLAADRDRGLLELCFQLQPLNALVADIRQELGIAQREVFPTAPSFREENGQCFFGSYSAVIRGNGDLHPCCMLINPEIPPVGNARTGSFADQWNGGSFTQMRHEMREVMLAGGEVEYQKSSFKILAPQCVNAHACGLKNMYFRGDEDFYRDLGEALDRERKREVRFTGNRQQLARALRRLKFRHPLLRRLYERLAFSSPRFRQLVKRALGVRY
jgi:MoaA/NifB/PqqE/SkfB family radical SAM enzyme